MCVGEALGEAESAVARLGALGVEGLGSAELADYLRRVRGLVTQGELLGARALAAFERMGGYRESGAADVVGWLSQTCKLTPESAQDRVALARGLERLPATADMLSHGELSFDQAALVARSTAKVRPEDTPRVEGMLLARAVNQDAGQMRNQAAAAVAEVDHDAITRDAARARERRGFRMGPDVDGNVRVGGDLTSDCAALIRARMEPFMAPAGKDDRRTADQRRHDALQELVRRAGNGGGSRTQVVVVAPLSAMLGEAGPPALLQGLVPISHQQLDEHLCGARLSAVLKDDKGNIAYAGRASRRFSPAKRRAMVADHPTCVFEGCNRLVQESDAHHLVDFSRGGETTLGNGAGLCFVHQPMVHRDGWEVIRREDGTYETLHPNHPDNPKRWVSPTEYSRRWREAIFESRQRQARRRAARTASVVAPPDVGG